VRVRARVVAAAGEGVGTQRLGGGFIVYASHGVGMKLEEIQPGDVELEFTPRSNTWDCPECGTHESMTDSDTLDVNWWCTVCEFSTNQEPPFSHE
jgi:rubredoxin